MISLYIRLLIISLFLFATSHKFTSFFIHRFCLSYLVYSSFLFHAPFTFCGTVSFQNRYWSHVPVLLSSTFYDFSFFSFHFDLTRVTYSIFSFFSRKTWYILAMYLKPLDKVFESQFCFVFSYRNCYFCLYGVSGTVSPWCLSRLFQLRSSCFIFSSHSVNFQELSTHRLCLVTPS